MEQPNVYVAKCIWHPHLILMKEIFIAPFRIIKTLDSRLNVDNQN